MSNSVWWIHILSQLRFLSHVLLPRYELQHEVTKKKLKATNCSDNLTGLINGWEKLSSKHRASESGAPSVAVSASDLDNSMVQYGGLEDDEADDVKWAALGSDVKVSGKAKVMDDKCQFHVESLISCVSKNGTY
jgi:hypothetical protein